MNKKISFEDALRELEEITASLERGSLSLEESIQAYSRGQELREVCEKRLNEAQKKIEILEKGRGGDVSARQVGSDEEGDIPEKNDIQGTLL